MRVARRLPSPCLCLALSLAASRAASAAEGASPPTPATMAFDVVDVPRGEAGPAGHVATLRGWLARNPGRTVVTLASVLAYREDAGGFVVGSVPGADARQDSEAVEEPQPTGLVGPGHGVDLGTPSGFATRHPTPSIRAITGIPHYGGGLEGFVLLVERP